MKITMSILKADVGSIGGHTLPSAEMLRVVQDRVFAERGRLLIDAYVFHCGDDISILMTLSLIHISEPTRPY